MSKKIEAIKDMVFYAQQKPESLAWYAICGTGLLHIDFGVVIETA